MVCVCNHSIEVGGKGVEVFPSSPPYYRLQRLAIVLLVLHYSVEFLFHASRLLHYHGKTNISTPGLASSSPAFLNLNASALALKFFVHSLHKDTPPPPPPPPPPPNPPPQHYGPVLLPSTVSVMCAVGHRDVISL